MEFTISNEAKTILSVLYNNGDFSNVAGRAGESFEFCHETSLFLMSNAGRTEKFSYKLTKTRRSPVG